MISLELLFYHLNQFVNKHKQIDMKAARIVNLNDKYRKVGNNVNGLPDTVMTTESINSVIAWVHIISIAVV
jgi:hypothetical protein